MKLNLYYRSHRPGFRTALAWCVLLLMASLPAHSLADGPAASEHAVKAAIIFKIAKFVSWPADAFSNQSDSLSICVQDDDSIGAALSDLSGKLIQGRRLLVKSLGDRDMVATSCQILFLSRNDAEQHVAVIDAIAKRPVLTIGDTVHFTRRGGIIALEIEQNRVQFAINIAASETAGLNISAQLLQLAKITDDGPETR